MLLKILSAEILVWMKEVRLESVQEKNIIIDSFRTYWRDWEFHLLLILSLNFQFLLMIMGYVRKRKNGGFFPVVSSVVFLTYLLADLAATVSLSAFLRAKFTLDNSLVLLWTPFLLLHLGGPFNVTAYSLEDNQMWTRHFIGFLIHLMEAFYICFNFGIHTDLELRLIAAPILIAGVIKYGERIWALWSASETTLVDRLFFGDREVIERIIEWDDVEQMNIYVGQQEIGLLRQAYLSFTMFMPLLLGFPLKFCWRSSVRILDTIRQHKTPEEAFRLVEIELSFLYDFLYSKIPIQIGGWGLIRHTMCFLFVISSLLAFALVSARRGFYGTADIFLTYLLFLGAILLECFSAAMRLLSTWAMVKPNGKPITSRLLLWAKLRPLVEGNRDMSMGQHDLIDQYCFKYSVAYPMRSFTRAVLGVNNKATILWNSTWVVVDAGLKEYIHRHIINLGNYRPFLNDDEGHTRFILGEILGHHGLIDSALDQRIKSAVTGFIDSIFVFHIATNLLYYFDIKKYPSDSLGEGFRISKCLSNYMMYLTLVQPLMLPKGMAYVINKDTKNQSRAMDVSSRNLKEAKTEFAEALHTMDFSWDHPAIMNSPFKKKLFNSTVLGTGTFMSQLLRHLAQSARLFENQEKWDRISRAWVDVLSYAAIRCPWKEHAQQLRDGGELLTYVALLLAHHGYAA